MSTDQQTAEISVIIVNYGAADLTVEAVESVLARDHGGRRVDIHVVDNASPGDDAAILRTTAENLGWAPRVTLYLEETNHGFGRGNNVVLDKLAASDTPPTYAFLLNPDAALRNEAIDQLATFLDANPQVGVAGARSVKPEGHAVPAAFRFPTLASEFAAAVSFGPISRVFRRKTVALDPDIATQRVGWVSGASMMLRFKPAADLGFFDPAYFLYYEEVDLMRRLGNAGSETWYVAEAEITHVEGASTDVKSADTTRKRRPAYWYESWKLYFLGHGRAYALATAFSNIAGAWLNGLISALRRREPAAPLNYTRDFWAVAVRPLLGLKPRTYD